MTTDTPGIDADRWRRDAQLMAGILVVGIIGFTSLTVVLVLRAGGVAWLYALAGLLGGAAIDAVLVLIFPPVNNRPPANRGKVNWFFAVAMVVVGASPTLVEHVGRGLQIVFVSIADGVLIGLAVLFSTRLGELRLQAASGGGSGTHGS